MAGVWSTTDHNIQLFRERLSEKVHATIPKGVVGDFEVTVLHIHRDPGADSGGEGKSKRAKK